MSDPELYSDKFMFEIFRHYQKDGFPILSWQIPWRECEPSPETTQLLFDKPFGITIPKSICEIIIEFSDICEFYGYNAWNGFKVLLNTPTDLENPNIKPYVWVEWEYKWYKFYLEQCSARMRENDQDGICKNIVISPGNGNHSKFGNANYGCCISHVINQPKLSMKGDNYSCRSCYSCVERVRTSTKDDQLDWPFCAVQMDGWSNHKGGIGHHYINYYGNIELFELLLSKGLKIKTKYVRTTFNQVIHGRDMVMTHGTNLNYIERLEGGDKHWLLHKDPPSL